MAKHFLLDEQLYCCDYYLVVQCLRNATEFDLLMFHNLWHVLPFFMNFVMLK